MPITPFHMTVAWAFHRLTGRRSLQPALLIGSMVPDLEIPFLVLAGYKYPYTRLVLHSFIGGALFGTIITVLILYSVFPYVASIFTRISFKEIRNMFEIKSAIFWSLIGVVLLHVFVDALHHLYNPLLWPFSSENVTLFVIGNYATTTIYVHILTGIPLFVVVLYLLIKRDPELWKAWLL